MEQHQFGIWTLFDTNFSKQIKSNKMFVLLKFCLFKKHNQIGIFLIVAINFFKFKKSLKKNIDNFLYLNFDFITILLKNLIYLITKI